ncbi:unnamed protein product [Protopolystoma xenopodis]|uniref:Peptidase M16 C-terminal domain-containing protein n=1 Tax=Protopolystoma xenopodis TaxID=117903 RepID=A0A448WMV5_9PLAT|nr:unnamed protein product [Protopolystoma xenopodis]
MGMYLAVRDFMIEYVRMATRLNTSEIERAKNQLKTHLLLQLDGTTPICEEIGRQMLVYGRRIPMKEMLKRIDSVSVDSVTEVCHKYFYDRCPAVACMGPVEVWPDYTAVRDMSFSLRI